MSSSPGTQHPAGTAGTPDAAGAPRPTALQRAAFTGYHWVLAVFLAAGCAQVFLAGLGVFSFGDHDVAGGTSAFDAHRALGWALGGVAVVILVLALIARAGPVRVILSGVLVVQTTLLQSLLAGLADNTALYGGLHALDGFGILGIAAGLYAAARRRP